MEESTKEELIEFNTELDKKEFFNSIYILDGLLKLNNTKIPNILSDLKEQNKLENKFYNAKEAFSKISSFLVQLTTSENLNKYYAELQTIEIDENNIDFVEIILDTIFDCAHNRSNSYKASVEDNQLYDNFSNYFENINVLYEFVDSVINAMMSLYDNTNLKQMEKKNKLITNLIPIINNNSYRIKVIFQEQDENFLKFIYLLNSDLENLYFSSSTRFNSFFNENESKKIKNMEYEQLQKYLASMVIENPNLREAKNLLKIKFEVNFLLKKLGEIRQTLNISDDIISEYREKYANEYEQLLASLS